MYKDEKKHRLRRKEQHLNHRILEHKLYRFKV